MRVFVILPFMTVCTVLAACSVSAEQEDVDRLGSAAEVSTAIVEGEKNFEKKIPFGNKRACATCHAEEDHFTLSPASVERRLAALPLGADGQVDYSADPLFNSMDADDFGTNFTRLRQGLTRVHIALPANVTVDELPGATSIAFFRGVPSIEDIALTDRFILVDGRAPTLQAQALGAARDHIQVTTDPTSLFLDDIAAYERVQFSSERVADAASRVAAGETNVPRAEPTDLTAQEQTGRASFDVRCATCHGGTSLTTGPLTNVAGGGGTTGAFRNVSVSLLNRAGLPVYTFRVTSPTGTVAVVKSPDPGRLLTTGIAADANRFDVPTVYGISHTAPYFHDNHAKTLDDVMKLYQDDFTRQRNQGNTDPAVSVMSADEMSAIVAYLKRL